MYRSHLFRNVLAACFCCVFIAQSIGQCMLDCHFPKQKKGVIAVSYTGKSYDKFYRGETLTEGNPANFGAVSSSIVSIYGQYALTDWLTGVVNLPYISMKNENGVLDPIVNKSEISSLQDLGLFLKARTYSAGSFVLGTGLGVTFPVSDYEAGSILSVGNRATAIDGLLLLQYKFGNGLFIEATPGYSIRNNDVPSAFVFTTKLGFAHSQFYVDVVFGNQTSTSGIDIGGEGFMGPPSLPKTKVNYNVLDVNAYVPVYGGFGISVGGGLVLGGRNTGQERYLKAGLVYNY